MKNFSYRQMTIQTLNNFIEDGLIDTDPEYQREIVWDYKKKQELIHTLLDGYPMPSLNFCNNGITEDGENVKYECMDGKNRLHSIRMFMTNQLKTKEGELFSELSKSASRSFNSIEITVCIFTDLTQKERQDYFIRIQGGVRLNQPEHIWAMNDHNLISEIKKVRKELEAELKCLWDTDRYNDLQLTLNIANMLNGKNPVLHSDAMTKWVDKQFKNTDYSDLCKNIKRVIILLHSIISQCTLHSKFKVPFTLDLAHWIISNDFKIPSIEIVTLFIGNIGQLKLDINYETTDQISKQYFNILNQGALSAQFSIKSAITRLQILSELFI